MTTKTETLAPHRKFIIEVRGEEIKVNKGGDKLHSKCSMSHSTFSVSSLSNSLIESSAFDTS